VSPRTQHALQRFEFLCRFHVARNPHATDLRQADTHSVACAASCDIFSRTGDSSLLNPSASCSLFAWPPVDSRAFSMAMTDCEAAFAKFYIEGANRPLLCGGSPTRQYVLVAHQRNRNHGADSVRASTGRSPLGQLDVHTWNWRRFFAHMPTDLPPGRIATAQCSIIAR